MRELQLEKEPTDPCMSKVVHERGTWGTETSQYPQEEKENNRFLKQWRAKQKEPKPQVVILVGFGLQYGSNEFRRNVLGKHTIEGESPVNEKQVTPRRFQSSARHEKSRMNERGPSRKAKY